MGRSSLPMSRAASLAAVASSDVTGGRSGRSYWSLAADPTCKCATGIRVRVSRGRYLGGSLACSHRDGELEAASWSGFRPQASGNPNPTVTSRTQLTPQTPGLALPGPVAGWQRGSLIEGSAAQHGGRVPVPASGGGRPVYTRHCQCSTATVHCASRRPGKNGTRRRRTQYECHAAGAMGLSGLARPLAGPVARQRILPNGGLAN
jgi:hypothetical protein